MSRRRSGLQYDRGVSLPSELPEQPQLRAAAATLERARVIGSVLDHKWRTIFISSEQVAVFPDADLSTWVGASEIVGTLEHRIPIIVPVEARVRWWDALGPAIRHDVPPDDPDFEAVFGPMADAARDLAPRIPDWAMVVERELREDEARRLAWHGRVTDLYLRVVAPLGRHVGTLHFIRPMLGDVVSARLSRGHAPMYERMLELRDPARRQAAILFADLEGSAELSRRLSSRAYFGLIRSLTDLVDAAVVASGGVIGKHAGDGASALFVVDRADAESAAARGAIDAARRIREGASSLLNDVTGVPINVGLHWGATLTIGQVSSYGRLEVTALGDEMNEAARIEAVATNGRILASKDLLERLAPEDADALKLDLAHMHFTAVRSLGADAKAQRDAGAVAVAEI
jgi:class 3 adenylate cyclase